MGANAQTTVPTLTAGQILTADLQNQSARTGVPVFADATARDAGFGGTGEKTLAEGQLAYLENLNVVQQYDGSSWTTVGPLIAIFNETQAQGTNGGTATSGSFVKRTLNTTVVNQIPNCSIASSVITLPAGTYMVQGYGTVFDVVNNYKSRLQNTTDASTAVQGMNGFVQTGEVVFAPVIGTFTITASKNFELQTRVGSTITTNGYGPAVNFGDEVYSMITITKLA